MKKILLGSIIAGLVSSIVVMGVLLRAQTLDMKQLKSDYDIVVVQLGEIENECDELKSINEELGHKANMCSMLHKR